MRETSAKRQACDSLALQVSGPRLERWPGTTRRPRTRRLGVQSHRMNTPRAEALRRSLSRRDLIVYGLLFIGPLAPVGVFGVLDARTGGAVALVYALATIAMAFTAWSYAQMSAAVPHAGSVFAYVTEGIGRRAGFLAGWLAMLDYLLIPSVAYLFSGIALHALMPAVPAWAFTVLAFAITTALNLAGVGVAARVGLVVLVAEVVVLAVFIVCAARRAGGARPGEAMGGAVHRHGGSRRVHDRRGDVGRGAVLSGIRRDCLVRGRNRGRFAPGRLGDPVLPRRRPGCSSWRSRISQAC